MLSSPGGSRALETRAWPDTEDETREIFEKFLTDVGGQGVEIVSRVDDDRVDALERALLTIPEFMFDIFAYEMRWPTWGYRDMEGDLLSEAVLERLERGEQLSPEDYRDLLAMRDALRRTFAALDGAFDGVSDAVRQGSSPGRHAGGRSGVRRRLFLSWGAGLEPAFARGPRPADGNPAPRPPP